MGQLALEFRLIVEQQSMGRAQFEPSVQFDVDGVFALKVGHVAEQDQHHHEPPELVDIVHIDIVARRFRLIQPWLLVIVGKLMVNEALSPQGQLRRQA